MTIGIRLGAVLLVTGLAVLVAPARAQVTELPLDVQQRLDSLGQDWNRAVEPNIAATVEVFRPLHDVAPTEGIVPRRDIAYGPHARHRLDLYAPAQRAFVDRPRGPVPIVIFIHGGSYTSGD